MAKDIIRQTRQAYNKIAHHFSGTRYDLWPELRQFAPLVKDGQNILDWGCGNGRLILLLKGKKVKYFGVDQSDELIKIAQKKYAAEIKEGWVKFFRAANTPPPATLMRALRAGPRPPSKRGGQPAFPEFFDLVFMVASFHHLPEKASRLALLKKIYKEMKQGGRLVMTNWNLDSDWAKKKIGRGIADWRKIGDNDFIIPWKNPRGAVEAERHYHCFAPDELRNLLKQAGFKVEKMGYDYMDKSQHTDKKGGRNLVTMAVK